MLTFVKYSHIVSYVTYTKYINKYVHTAFTKYVQKKFFWFDYIVTLKFYIQSTTKKRTPSSAVSTTNMYIDIEIFLNWIQSLIIFMELSALLMRNNQLFWFVSRKNQPFVFTLEMK